MQRYRKKGDPYFVEDPWAAYEGVYHYPTKNEVALVMPFLVKFALEDDGFVEDEDEGWVEAKNYFQCPNLRPVLIEFLRQVRESKGYDVDTTLGFMGSPFIPRRLEEKKYHDEGMVATHSAIKEINCLTRQSGTRYELVSLDKFVWTVVKSMLLTFTAMETDADAMEIDDDIADADADADACLKTIQAMVHQPRKLEFRLVEWKFKPDPLT